MRGKSPNRFQRSQKFSKHYYFMIFFSTKFWALQQLAFNAEFLANEAM
jgi:hypothetical protein